ncbi:MAG: right-handed parallel beta-helix repeat-containing protein [Candidatus Eisenbacteria bacterium]
MSAKLTMAALTMALLVIPGMSTANTIHVPGDWTTIQDAIEHGAEGDTILVAPDTYTGPSNRDLDFGGVNMLLVAEGDRVDTVIDCEGAGRGFHFSTGEDTTLVIQGFTVTNAVADTGAGAKCIMGSSPKFVDCAFSGNTATDRGGGISCRSSSPVVVGCVFDGNVVSGGTYAYGGAISCIANADARIAGCDFTGNEADGFGGAVYCNQQSDPRMTGCTFSANTAGSGGGGLFSVSSAPVITGCTFGGNSGQQGGAIYTQSSPVTVTGSRFVGNSAAYTGGAVSFLYATSNGTLTDCTFVGNTSQVGAAIKCAFGADALITGCTFVGNDSTTGDGTLVFSDASPTVENAIIAFASGGSAVRCTSGTETPSFSYCVVFDNAGGDDLCGSVGDTMNRDPRLCDIAGSDYTLCANSPCIAGNNAWGEDVGAHGAGCGNCDSPVEVTTWSIIKGSYR